MNTAVRYLKSLLLVDLLRGLWLTGYRLFARKVTVQYAEEKTPQSARFCGLHALRRYTNGTRRTTHYDIDLFRCVYCGFCEEACPTDAIVLTRLFEFHFGNRGEEVIHKQELLAIGSRLEAQIAADRRADAAFR